MAIPNDDKSKMSLEYEVVNTNGSTRAGHDDWLFLVILSCLFYTNKHLYFLCSKPRICILESALKFPPQVKARSYRIFLYSNNI
jgi:hypothetical protein